MLRPEFPNPQCQRDHWENLNGTWEFEDDRGVSGIERKLYNVPHLKGNIEVPFCPESQLSGIGDVDFHTCVWYRRDFVSNAKTDERVILHFGAVDYDTTLYVNGKKVGEHHGGYSSFSFDVTDFLSEDVNSLCVRAYDNDHDHLHGHGKQSGLYNSHGCFYTRVTGIWQTVWVEYVPVHHIKSFRFYTNVAQAMLTVELDVTGNETVTLDSTFEGKPTGKVTVACHNGVNTVVLPLTEKRLWELGKGGLYDLTLTYGQDTVKSYFGLREVALDGKKFLLNGKSVFLRTVLDQGFYPDGVYTAPSADALKHDIEMSMAMGFNGARLHQKVFEPLFLYYADKLGYMVWGEYGNWGYDVSDSRLIPHFLEDWLQVLKRDVNHPSIIGWCPFNETWDYCDRRQDNAILATAYRVTKAYDVERPCIDTSGNYHVKTDIWDVHDYIQSPEKFATIYGNQNTTLQSILAKYDGEHPKQAKYGQTKRENVPFFVSEYGGIKWDVKSGNNDAWGYGEAPKTLEEFLKRYKGLTDLLLDNPNIMGFCYTQLTDVEQETNGLYNYDRTHKFSDEDIAFIKNVNSRKAVIED